jgi:hypothetical protein
MGKGWVPASAGTSGWRSSSTPNQNLALIHFAA